MTQEYQTGETFLISGKFPMPVNVPDISKVRHLMLFLEKSRSDASEYYSLKTNPPEKFLCTFTECRDEYVIARHDMRYDLQIYQWGDPDPSQLYPFLHCYLKEIFQRLRAIGIPLGLLFPELGDPTLFFPLNTYPQILKFVCYNQTAISATFKYLLFDECPDVSAPNIPPPPPPLPSPKFPPGTPITPSDGFSPRPPFTNPADYDPAPIDKQPTPPPDNGEPCQLVSVSWTVNVVHQGQSQSIPQILTVYGETSEPFLDAATGGTALYQQCYITCRGIVQLGQECGALATTVVTNYPNDGGMTIADIVVEPLS